MSPLPVPSGQGLPAGVILAGGSARRMGGGDKPLRLLAGVPLLGHVATRIGPQVAALALNANGPPERFAAFGLEVLPDPVPGRPGPLAGVLAALRWAAAHGAAEVLSVPGDTPFLPRDLVARLRAAGGNSAVVCAAAAGRLHPTVALWRTDLAAPLATALAAGVRRVESWAREQGLTVAEFPEAEAFLNINTPEDLATAEAGKEGKASFP